ncbi:MAG: Ig-like domain-containing protein [Desulfobacterales bacterium]|nr:Ig-like domain-containing protein [Desulfobacterales bacterium]
MLMFVNRTISVIIVFFCLVGISSSLWAASEIEPNDSQGQAQSITSGQAVTGTVSSTSDIDFYLVEASAKGTLTVRLDTAGDEYYGWRFSAVDAAGTVLGSAVCSSTSCRDSGKSFDVGLAQAGNYYLKVEIDRSGQTPNSAYTILGTYFKLNEGLVAYYPFNGNANDESGNGHHGVVHGVTLIEDRFGNPNSAYEFTGNEGAYGGNKFIEIPNIIDGFNKLTISLWVKEYYIGYIHGEDYISFGVDNSGRVAIEHEPWAGDYLQFIVSNNNKYTGSVKTDFSTNWTDTFQHYVLVYDGENGILKGYRNGVIIGTSNDPSGDLTTYGNYAGIGKHWWNNGAEGSTRFNGVIDDIRIYNRALSEAEIQELYAEQSSLVLSGGPSSPTSQTGAVLSVEGDNITVYKYKLDDGSYGAETPAITPITLTGLGDGSHTVYVIAKDASDNWTSEENAVSVSWVVDTLAPVLNGLTDDSTSKKSKTWNWDASDASHVSFRYLIDQNVTWDNPSGDYADVKSATKDNGDGTWHLHVQAKDAAGNESDVATVSAVLDNTPPVAVISGAPGSTTTKTDITLTVSGTGLVAYQYKLNAGSYSSERTAETLINLNALTDGVYTVSVIGKDQAGNWQSTSLPSTVSWTLDTTVPSTTVLDLASEDDTGVSSSDNITSITSGLTISGSGEEGATVRLFDSGNEIAGATGIVSDGSFAIDISLSEGAHAITAVQTDTNGYTSPPSEPLNITIDATAPSTPLNLDLASEDDTGISNSDNITQKAAALTLTGTGDNGETVWLYDNNVDIASVVVAAGGFSFDISLAEGSHTITARQMDNAGNVSSPTGVMQVVVDYTAPVVTATPEKELYNYAESYPVLDVNLQANETAMIYYTYRSDIDPITAGDEYDNGSALSIDRTRTIRFAAKDLAGNQSGIYSKRYELDWTFPQSPVIDAADNMDEGNDATPAFAWKPASDAHHHILQYADNINFTNSFQIDDLTDASYAVTQYLPRGGLWYWRVRAVDAAGNNSEWATFQYNFINDNSIRKAIIVAGSGPYPGNALWTATVALTNMAFDTLFNRGYRSDNIKYLSHQSYSENPNVDAGATKINLENAITQWATDADEFVLYLNGHAGKGKFTIGENESLTASELDAWLDALQDQRNIKVIIIYEACNSGSFLPVLAAKGDQVRILISSADADQRAWLVSDGTVSFSWSFWTRTGAGFNVYDAFANATKAISNHYGQTPLIDTNGDGKFNEKADKEYASNVYIGYKAVSAAEFPEVATVSPPQFLTDETSATVFADGVIGATNIVRVWATVLRPDFDPGPVDDPVTYLPEVELTDKGNSSYKGIYDKFGVDGRYILTVYAKDDDGLLSEPMQVRVYKNVVLGDLDGDKNVNLADLILALQVLSGLNPAGLRTNYVASGVDVDGNDEVGMAEMLYIMQKVSGMR